MAKKTIPFSGVYSSKVQTTPKMKAGRKLSSGKAATRTKKANPFTKAASRGKKGA